MDFSGSLADVDLAEAFHQICEKRLTGLLRIRDIRGRTKLIELSEGEITVIVQGGGRRMRLGDLLIARGRINQEQLEEALKAQRFHGRRFGEVLVELGYCTDNDIKECVRFQIEEDVSEVLTWEEGVAEFKEGERIESSGEDMQGSITTRLSIDANALLLEAARRAEKWKSVARLVPSVNCVFRLTVHGEKLRDAATRGGRKLLDLIDQGYNVEGIISRTFVGRFGVMRALSELMQSGSIMEVPRNEVGGFAEELKKANRYEQAIGAYRRLLEVSRDPRAKPEILRQISECEEALSTIAATERIEQTRVVPRRPGAPPAGVAQKIIWRPLTGVLVLILIVLLGITVFAVDKLREIALPKNLAAYKETKAAASKLVTSGDYRGAMRVWEDFLAQQPEGQGSDFARGDLNSITKVYEGLVKKELARAGKLEAELKLGEAIAAYEEALGKYPDYDEIADVRNRLAAAKAKQDELLKRLSEQELAAKLAQAEKLENNENLSEALEIYKEVARSKGPSSESAKAAVGRLDEKMRRVLALFETGLAHEKSSEYGLALKSFEEADAEWPGSKWAREAKIHASAVKRRARAARLLFEEANGLEKQGRNEEALRKYLIVAQNYKGFDEARPAREKMNELTGFTRKADEMLARAAEQERSGDLDGAFKIYTRLLSIYGGTSSVKKLRLPVVVHSVPPGAEVYRAGKLLGKAPVELRFKPYESGELELKLSGFEPLTAKYENIRRRTFVCHMRKTPIFVADLGLRMSGEALPTGARIYVAAERSVLALRRFSGKEVWRCELFKPSEVPDEMGHNPLVSAADPAYWDVRGRPALVVGHLYVAARDGRLHVLEATTGNEVGKVTLKAPVDTGIETVTSELMAGKPFGYAVDWQGNFLGLDLAADGKLRWTKPVGARSHHKGAVTGRLICYGAASGKLAAFDLRTGTPAWEVQTAGKILTAPSARGDLVAVYSEGDGLYLVRADGTVKARRKLPLRGEGWPCLGDKAVALCEGDGKLRGFDVDGLKDLWEGSVDGKASGAPATTGRRVYIGSAGGKVYCFDMEKGTVLWQLAAGSPVTSPMSLSEGALFFGTEAGKFFALEVE